MVAMLGGGEAARITGMELAPQDVRGTADTLGSPRARWRK